MPCFEEIEDVSLESRCVTMDDWLEFPDALNVDFKDFSSLYTEFSFWGTKVQVNADIISYIGNLLGISWQLMTETHRAETTVTFCLARQHERTTLISNQAGLSPSYTTITYDEGNFEVNDDIIGEVRARFGLSWTKMSDNERAREIVNHVKTLWFKDGTGLNIRKLSPVPPELDPSEANGQQNWSKSTLPQRRRSFQRQQDAFNLTLDIMDDAITVVSYEPSINLLDNTHVLNEDNVYHIIWLLKRVRKEQEKRYSLKQQILSLHAIQHLAAQPQKLKSRTKLKVMPKLRDCASKKLFHLKEFLQFASYRLVRQD